MRLQTYIKRQVFPQAPSPTITSFLLISAMMCCWGLIIGGWVVVLEGDGDGDEELRLLFSPRYLARTFSDLDYLVWALALNPSMDDSNEVMAAMHLFEARCIFND
jgi:hypothetical protein